MAVTPGDTHCPANRAFGGLPIRSASVRAPLALLPWTKASVEKATAMVTPLRGKLYHAQEVDTILEQVSALPLAALDDEARVALRVREVIVRCSAEGLDLEFFLLALNVSPSLGNTWEARRQEVGAPERQVGFEGSSGRVRAQPRVGYLSREGAGGGLSATYSRDQDASAYWRSLSFDGYSTDKLHDVKLAVDGSRNHVKGPFARTAWQLGYVDKSEPAVGPAKVEERALEAQLLTQTHPLGTVGATARLGAALNTGDHVGRLPVPGADVAGDERYRALKLMAGATARLDRQTFSANYAIELGRVRSGADGEWVKHVVDIAHDVRWKVGDHRSLSLETRVGAGTLRESGPVSPNIRFFAGGRERFVFDAADWQIRGAPVLRSMGTNALAGDPNNPGYRRFAAINLTAAMPVFHRPLVPTEVSADAGVRDALRGQINSAVDAYGADLRTESPSYVKAIGMLPVVKETLGSMKAALGESMPSQGSAQRQSFDKCIEQIDATVSAVELVLGDAGLGQLGGLEELLPGNGSTDSLGAVAATCGSGLGTFSQREAVERLRIRLTESTGEMSRLLQAADPAVAQQAAEREFAPVRRIVDTLIDEVNVVAVSPLLMLDAVRLSPAFTGPRMRLGIGTGLRLTLVDSVDMSIGYMVNIRRQAGESRGAFFATVQFKDLF